MVDLETIYQAHERIRGTVVETPFAYAPRLSEQCGAEIYLKKENLQVTGAFKIRGAYNKIASLSDAERVCGVIAASAGNHAQGVAMAAQMFGIKALIVMPESTPLTKINGVRYYGAEVILAGSNYDEAYAYASTYGSENGLVFVHPFTDTAVMAGQGTIALEMIDSMSDLDAVIIPVGGGGLISGMASAFKALSPKTEVIGVSALGAPAMKESFEAKKAIDSTSVRTIADGIAVRDTSEITLGHIIECVDRIVSVDDEEIANAILFLLERQKLVVEGAGAVGVAALLHDKLSDLKGKKVGVVLSGGNMDVTLLSIIIEKGLIKSGRKMKLTVTLVDKPGALMKLTEMLQGLNANIVHIDYDRTSTTLAYGDANVMIHLETKGEEHQSQIRALLKEHRYLSSEEH
ncbi:MAG: threonine ammonia-lyase [Sulfuricurvum sp.]|uniref:threonine ammonia-lyase n=1 Tax=Sulfuricurvum sp. TaxID=2025608 RepID=UPI0026204C0B|nr:threonine ammonia-lyase [Sulfuricurvum sp.]MDD5117628.1 threonine ammonia-lyase [Sulfuricurvum sp.]